MEPGAGGGKGFAGLSTLRNGDGDAEEDRGGHGGAARRPAAHLEAYLKDSSSKPVGKRKRRKKNRSSTKGNLMIVDAEEGTAIPVATMDSGYGDEDVNDELGPVVVNAEEVERDEALRKRRTIARSNQRWQTVTTAAASTPSAVPAGGSRSRSPSPGTGTGLGGRHDTDTDTDDDDDGGSDLEVARRPRVRYDSPDSSDVDVERRGGGSGAKGSDSSDDGGSDSDSDMDVRRRGRASSTSSEGRGGGGRDLNPGPSAGGMTDGTSTGLVSSKALAQELERKRQEKLRKFAEMDPSVSGRAAETVYRDRDTGARVTKSELEQKEESRRQQEREKPMWSAGLAQKRRRVRELRETYGHGEPSSTDGAGLRDRQRFGDPMAHLVKKKAPVAHEEDGETFYQDRFGVSLEELRKGGFVIPAGVPPHSWLKRGVRCPENRFGIRPGAHWDGVDRSNGFERDYFREMNKKKERDRMAFMWSQEDM